MSCKLDQYFKKVGSLIRSAASFVLETKMIRDYRVKNLYFVSRRIINDELHVGLSSSYNV